MALTNHLSPGARNTGQRPGETRSAEYAMKKKNVNTN